MGAQSSKVSKNVARKFPVNDLKLANDLPRVAPVPPPSTPASEFTANDINIDKSVISNFQSLKFDISSRPEEKPYQKENAMINILQNRHLRDLQLQEQRIAEQSFGNVPVSPDKVKFKKLNIRDITELLSLRRENPHLWTDEKLAAEFGISQQSVNSLLRFWNIHEISPIKGGTSETLLGIWVDDIMEFRRGESQQYNTERKLLE
ncbi:hypothetical protein HK098_000805 [Nowakowskiella sp. JEL0407]|nr:hypothetical protein HK098_000805 [Nowakowskiella sp. JEL0407]